MILFGQLIALEEIFSSKIVSLNVEEENFCRSRLQLGEVAELCIAVSSDTEGGTPCKRAARGFLTSTEVITFLTRQK